MSIFNRKSPLERAIEKVSDSLDTAAGITSSLPGAGGSGKALNAVLPKSLPNSLPKGQAAKAGLIAGGLLGLTATSAGISSLRRRKEGARDDS